MRKVLSGLAAAVLVPAAVFAAEPSEGGGKGAGPGRRLVGEYRITAGEKNGEAVPEERLKDNAVAITEDTFAVVDRDKKELYAAKYKLGGRAGEKGDEKSEKGVWKIDLESTAPKEGDKAVGLIKRDGKEVWLIYSLTGERPEGFEKTEEGQHLFKLTRISKEPGPEAEAAEQAGGSGE